MNITEVRLTEADGKGNIRAFASITFDDCLVVDGFSIMESKEELTVRFPSKRTRSGNYRGTAFSLNDDFKNLVETAILAAYEQMVKQDLAELEEESVEVEAEVEIEEVEVEAKAKSKTKVKKRKDVEVE